MHKCTETSLYQDILHYGHIICSGSQVKTVVLFRLVEYKSTIQINIHYLQENLQIKKDKKFSVGLINWYLSSIYVDLNKICRPNATRFGLEIIPMNVQNTIAQQK